MMKCDGGGYRVCRIRNRRWPILSLLLFFYFDRILCTDRPWCIRFSMVTFKTFIRIVYGLRTYNIIQSTTSQYAYNIHCNPRAIIFLTDTYHRPNVRERKPPAYNIFLHAHPTEHIGNIMYVVILFYFVDYNIIIYYCVRHGRNSYNTYWAKLMPVIDTTCI